MHLKVIRNVAVKIFFDSNVEISEILDTFLLYLKIMKNGPVSENDVYFILILWAFGAVEQCL